MRLGFLIVLLALKGLAFSQSSEKSLIEIKKMVSEINTDSGYVVKTLENEQFMSHNTDGGGDLNGYYKNGKLVKIVERIGLSSCVNVSEFYLTEGKLIFVFTQGSEFLWVDSSATFNPTIQEIKMECRYYFKKDKLLKSILWGGTRCAGNAQEEWAKLYQNDCLRYIDLLNRK
jgi:hypothetical protein